MPLGIFTHLTNTSASGYQKETLAFTTLKLSKLAKWPQGET